MLVWVFCLVVSSLIIVVREGASKGATKDGGHDHTTWRETHIFLNKLNHRSTNTGLGSTTSAPRGGDIGDEEREVRAGRSQGSRPSRHARTKEEAIGLR